MAYDLTKEVFKILNQYSSDCTKEFNVIAKDVAKKAVKKLNYVSPKNPKSHGKNGKHYCNDWYVKHDFKKYYDHYIVANHQYQLTHLLENGHVVKRNGKNVGMAAAKRHIKDVEEWAVQEIVAKSEEYLGYAGKDIKNNTTIKVGGDG